jgi:hypothetical protein
MCLKTTCDNKNKTKCSKCGHTYSGEQDSAGKQVLSVMPGAGVQLRLFDYTDLKVQPKVSYRLQHE